MRFNNNIIILFLSLPLTLAIPIHLNFLPHLPRLRTENLLAHITDNPHHSIPNPSPATTTKSDRYGTFYPQSTSSRLEIANGDSADKITIKPPDEVIKNDNNDNDGDDNKISAADSYILALRRAKYPLELIDRHSQDLLAVGLLLLVPITFGVLELAERISRSMSIEEFPDRGRERDRWSSLEEREKRLVKRRERERETEKEKKCFWWRNRR